MPDPVIFVLEDGERRHPLWARLKAHLTERLAQCRIRNDRATLTEQETAALRGEIKALKGIIALGDEPPLID